jgi:phosphatidylserine decarboxylase
MWPLVRRITCFPDGASATRWRVRWWKNLLIDWFIRHFNVDMAEAVEQSPAHYPNFNSFFTRSLKPGARPQPGQPRAITSPVDGRISQIGRISDGRLIQAKGRDFSLVDLLGGDTPVCRLPGEVLRRCTAPRDYHRVHMPCDARLTEPSIFLASSASPVPRAMPGFSPE